MGIFDKKKLILLQEKVGIIKSEAQRSGKFSLFCTRYASEKLGRADGYKGYKYLYEMFLEKDKICNISYDVGIKLDELSYSDTILIHRTNLLLNKNSSGIEPNDILYSIVNDGLKNFGHANAYGGGAFSSSDVFNLSLTTTPLVGLAGYINLFSSYKSNDTVIILKFPSDLVNKEGDIVNKSDYGKIYNMDVNPPVVKPEYIYGVIFKKKDMLDEFYSREEILKELGSKTK